MGRIKTTSELDIIAGTTFSSTSTGTTTINSGTGQLSISSDASATTVNIATGSDVKTVTIGSVNGASTMNIRCGTGAMNIGTSIAKTINIGNTTGATAVNINTGTAGFTMSSASGVLIRQLATGEMTQPLQTAFLAYMGSAVNNVTGNGATYTLGSGTALTELFDQGNDFNTNGTFTAPVTGRYILAPAIQVSGITVLMTTALLSCVTSNRTYLLGDLNPGLANNSAAVITMIGSCIADMDAADTATFTLQISGGAGDTADIASGISPFVTWVSGCLLV
jgi:hypothetical protein